MSRTTETIGLVGKNFTVSCFACLRKGISDINTETDDVDFSLSGDQVASATLHETLVSIWDSSVIDTGGEVLLWKSMSVAFTEPSGGKAYSYFRSSDSLDDLGAWRGPFNAEEIDLSIVGGRYGQIRIVLVCDGLAEPDSPECSSASVIVYMKDVNVSFFTKSFDLGFKAEHLMLSYNGTIDDGMLVEFAVSGKETGDFSSYMKVEPNKMTRLDSISPLSDSIKVAIRGVGSSTNTFVIDEFALVVSDKDGKTKILSPS